MRQLIQGAGYNVTLKVFLSSDHSTAATGKTVAIKISKDGGAFANPAAGATNATEVANGWYVVSLGSGDVDTAGDLVVRGTASACDDSEQICQVSDTLTSLIEAVAVTYDGYTLPQAMRLILAPLTGKSSGLATTTAVFRAADDSKARITATVDADGNRSAVTLDAS